MTVLAVTLTVGLGLVAIEAWGWLPRLSRFVIRLATRPLQADDRAIRRAEWIGELEAEYSERRITGLIWTLKLIGVGMWEAASDPRTPISILLWIIQPDSYTGFGSPRGSGMGYSLAFALPTLIAALAERITDPLILVLAPAGAGILGFIVGVLVESVSKLDYGKPPFVDVRRYRILREAIDRRLGEDEDISGAPSSHH